MLLFLFACNDQSVGVYNTPPSVAITSPEDGTAWAPGSLVELRGVARDDQQSADTLDVRFSSSVDGELGVVVPDADGNVFLPVLDLAAGSHAITLTALDESGEAGAATVAIEVGFGGEVEGAPTVTLIGPTDGSSVSASETVTVVGTATDDEQAWDTLIASVLSSRDGILWTGAPASNGAVSVDLPPLAVGTHLLSLSVEDSDGHVAFDKVQIEVLEDARPKVTIHSPTAGSTWWTTDTIPLEATVSDDVSAPDTLALTWTSDVSGPLHSGYPDSAGYTARGVALGEALHVITLSATDEDGNTGSSSVTIEVIDPLNHDGDGDGITENEGDCDDTDAGVYDGATETCDDLDEDCSGEVNDPWMDAYEDNDTLAAPYDLGEVDNGFLWSGSSATMSGLTVHYDADEDWFTFDCDDEWYDNCEFVVTASGLPSAGNFVLELWDVSAGKVKDSDSGSGKLGVSFTGSLTDTSEDKWAIRVYSASWDTAACTATYTLKVDA